VPLLRRHRNHGDDPPHHPLATGCSAAVPADGHVTSARARPSTMPSPSPNNATCSRPVGVTCARCCRLPNRPGCWSPPGQRRLLHLCGLKPDASLWPSRGGGARAGTRSRRRWPPPPRSGTSIAIPSFGVPPASPGPPPRHCCSAQSGLHVVDAPRRTALPREGRTTPLRYSPRGH